ncbi:MAG: response regulator [Candidatus Pacebacteria bacterium]|nr:response regulator [Candidatus Paceibacterota bacterium]MBP9701053.1 response regulator [Candidatus Paceibacterota bacterium]
MDATTPTQKQKSILIVDDDTFLLDMYAMRFSQAQFNVTTAMSAQETLTKLREGLVPDIMLLDVVMPSVDGFELLETINTEGLAPKTVKIYLSNLGQDQDIERGKALGAASYIVKANSTPSEVVAHVLEVMQQHGV